MAANVIAQVVGGQKKIIDKEVETVGDVRTELYLSANYKASVNGEPSDSDSEELEDRDFVSFAEQVKGA